MYMKMRKNRKGLTMNDEEILESYLEELGLEQEEIDRELENFERDNNET